MENKQPSDPASAPAQPHRRRLVLEVFLVFLAFLAIYLITASDAAWHTDGLVRMYVARNLLEYGDPILREAEQGEVSATVWAVTGHDGRFYSFYGLGHSLFIMPGYALANWIEQSIGGIPYIWDEHRFFLGMLAPVLSALVASSVFATTSLLGYRRSSALLTAGVVGLATIIWPNARDLQDNLLETSLIMVSIALLVAHHRFPELKWPPLVAGASFGLAFVTRSSAALAFPGLMLILIMPTLLEERALSQKLLTAAVLFGLGALLTAWIWPVYNQVRFGDPMETGYSQMFLRDAPAPGQPLLPGLATWLFSPWHGLLIYTPLLLLLPFLARHFAENRVGLWVLVGGILTLISVTLFYSTFRGLGKWTYGPGYLMMGIPWVLVTLVVFFENFKNMMLSVRVLGTILLGLNVIATLPGVFLPIGYAALYIGQQISLQGGDDLSWIPMIYSPIVTMGEQSIQAIGNVLSGRAATFDVIPNSATWLESFVGLNAPDWWWVMIFYRGFRPIILIPMGLLASVAVTLFFLLRLPEPES